MRGLEMLVARLGGDELEQLARSIDAVERREVLAEVVRRWIGDAAGRTRSFVANVGSVVLSVLATRHALEGSDEPASLAAAAAVPWLLEPERRVVLLPAVAELLEDLRDGIAVEDGRGRLVRRARELLERAVRLDPLALHISRGSWLLGGRRVTFRRSATRRGRRVAEARHLGVSNAEGRLLALCASGRAPTFGCASALSHLKAALTEASGGTVTINRKLEIVPPLVLTAKAARAAGKVRWVQAPERVSSSPDDEVRFRHAAPTKTR